MSGGDLEVKTMGDERAWALLWFQFSDGVECGYGNIEVTILTECFRRPTDHQRESLLLKKAEKGCRSVAKLCPTVCYPRDCSMPGFRILPEFAQVHVD